MKNTKKLLALLVVLALALTSVFVLVACDDPQDPPADTTYALNYALGDHAASGATTPPTVEYKENDPVTLEAAPAAEDGWHFTGWSDGTTTHAASASYTMPAHAVTMTAQWAKDPVVVTVYGEISIDTVRSGHTYQVKVNVTVTDGVVSAVEVLDNDAGNEWSTNENYGNKAGIQAWVDEAIVGETVETVLGWKVDITQQKAAALIEGPKYASATETGARVIAAVQNALEKIGTHVVYGEISIDTVRSGHNYQVKVNVTVTDGVVAAVEVLDNDAGNEWSTNENYGNKAGIQAWVDEAIVGETVETVLGWKVDITQQKAAALIDGPKYASATETGARVIAAVQNALGKLGTKVVTGEISIDTVRSGHNYQVKVNVTVTDGVVAAVEVLDNDAGNEWSTNENYGNKAGIQAWVDEAIVGETVETVLGWKVDITQQKAAALIEGPKYASATETGARVIAAIQAALGKDVTPDTGSADSAD